MTHSLFSTYELGPYPLSNRIVMAPMTRSRAAQPGNVPSPLNALYYAQRASAGLIVTDLIGGRIDATLSAFITVQPHAVSGRLRILGVARETRAPNYPQWPTLAETVPGFQSGGWFGAVAPAGMAKEQIAYLNREMNTAMRTPDIREKAAILGLDLHTESPEYFTEAIRRDFEKWGKLARDIGFKPQ